MRVNHTLTVRLNKELAAWLKETASATGLSRSQIIRAQLEKARASGSLKTSMKHMGAMDGLPKGLSTRKGFANN